MNKTLIFREIISTKPHPVFNDYYAIERVNKKCFYFKAHAEDEISIEILDEKQLINEFKNARKAKQIEYFNIGIIEELNLTI